MTNAECTKLAGKIFNAIKKKVSDARKYNKDNGFTDVCSWSRRRQQADVEVWDNTIWKDNRKIVKNYIVKVDGKEIGTAPTHYDVRYIFSELRDMLNKQKKTKGWSGLNWQDENVELESCDWSGYRTSIVTKVCLADVPCSEYKSLMNYINKFGQTKYGGKVNLGNYELFSAAKGGKRGYLWDEHGERIFLDNCPKHSTKILDELRKYRGTKDMMICERGEEDYLDEEERRYSEYAEIECEGEHRKFLRVVVKTPTGRVKLDTKIY